MRNVLLVFFIYFSTQLGYSQGKFRFPKGVSKDKISFEMINNLVIIPVKVNGVSLTFLLDTGVSTTLIFSLTGIDSLTLNKPKIIKLRGFGTGTGIKAYSSIGNRLEVGQAKDYNHTINIVINSNLNLSKRMGIPIHGILGYDFFKDFIVVTKYHSKKIYFYKPESFTYKKCKKCVELPLTFYKNKPYLPIKINDDKTEKLVLLDSGSSDAVWLLEESGLLSESPKNYFEDYLGSGLSGSIYGKRSKIKSIKLGSYTLQNSTVAYPDTLAFQSIRLFDRRLGTLGSEILKRFTVTIDYANRKIRLKKNAYFKNPFHYNMSGLIIAHEGVEVVKEEKNLGNEDLTIPDDAVSIPITTVINYFLVPKFIVAEVTKDSPADVVGIKKGDEIVSINGKKAYLYKLAQLIEMFSSKEGKKITMTIKRNGITYRKKFYLKERI